MLLAEEVVSFFSPKHRQWQDNEAKRCGHHIPGIQQQQKQDGRNNS